jgi:hypothetical protein
MPGLEEAVKRWCRSIPRPGTIDAAGVRATCLCGKPITYVDGLVNQAPYWRHPPKRRTLQ